ncbi:MAG: DUF1552 domain-containing protein [Verrucomicrobiales bacterium]
MLLPFLAFSPVFSGEKTAEQTAELQPFLTTYCFKCHDEDVQKGDLRLDSVAGSIDPVKDRDLWLSVLEQLETREMPPKDPLPSEDEYLAADTTRVGTLMTAHGFSRQNFSFLDGVTSDHHGMSHHKNKDDLTSEYIRVSTWYIEQLSYFLQRMKSIREGDGNLLDNSIVLYGSGMKDGNGHVKDDLPILVAGRGGGTLRQGRHLRREKGTPHSNLLHTVGRAMGLEQESFNGVSTGVVDGLIV